MDLTSLLYKRPDWEEFLTTLTIDLFKAVTITTGQVVFITLFEPMLYMGFKECTMAWKTTVLVGRIGASHISFHGSPA